MQHQYDFQESIGDIWDNNVSIFHFKSDKVDEYLEQDLMGSGPEERKLDFILDSIKSKWERMDRYWFQKNKNLGLKVKKQHKDQPVEYQLNYPRR